MWATRLRCPSEAAYPQPSPPPRFCPCRRATPPSASGCSSPGAGAENCKKSSRNRCRPAPRGRRRQGNRVKESSFRDEACEEVVVPCGGFALQAHGAFCGGISHEVARYVFYRGEVGGSVILTDAAFVVAENHVHHPMEAILYRPMIADEWPKNIRQQQ